MKLRRRTLLELAAAATAVSLSPRLAPAQTFPTRPITIVVPFPAGGPTDTLGRVLADRMRNALGQSVIIENLTGQRVRSAALTSRAHCRMVTLSFSAIGKRTSLTAPP